MNTVTRRTAGALLAATLAIGLSACGAGEASTSGEAGVDDDRRTIDFEFEGYTTQLPAEPEKVVVLDSRTGLEFALLAEWPVIASDFSDEGGPIVDALPDDVARLAGARTEPDLEEVASHHPDMLVVSESWWNYYQDNDVPLGDIAPVFIVDEPDVGESWKETFAGNMSVIDKSDEAEELLKQYEATVVDLRQNLPSEAQGVTLAFATGEMTGADVSLGHGPLNVFVARDLGFEVITSDELQPSDGFLRSYSTENLDVFTEADFLFVVNLDDDSVFESQAWNRQPAVGANRVAEMPTMYNAGMVLTAESLARHMADAVSAAY